MATFILPQRPPLLTIYKTCIYKTVGNVSIPLDIYLPDDTDALTPHPIMIFIHGGGWTGGNRSDYSRPLFRRFLSRGFILISADYRLLPETSFEGQQEDIRDLEDWLHQGLPGEIKGLSCEFDLDRVVVVGASAGALLALLTPKLWNSPPSAIVSMYGPTNMHTLPYSGRGKLSSLEIPPCTPELLAAATTFASPPTAIPVPTASDDYTKPRGLMSLHIFRKAILAEFLLQGLPLDSNDDLQLPQPGSVDGHDIDEISPLYLATARSHKVIYPPLIQIMGSDDEIFFPQQHVHPFHAALELQGITCKLVTVPGAGHAFDIWANYGEEIDLQVLKPAVDWVCKVVGIKSVHGQLQSWWKRACCF